jgi:hypothetical protein
MKNFFIYILLLFLLRVQSYNFVIDRQIGSTAVSMVYNTERGTNDTIIYAYTDVANQRVYLIEVFNTTTVNTIGCRKTSQKRVIWGPVGCSDPDNPRNALIANNCFQSDVEVAQRRAIFLNTWYLSKDDPLCFLLGGEGDPRLCMGPLRIIIDNQNTLFPRGEFTSQMYLESRYLGIDTVAGPGGMMPAIMQVQVVQPTLDISMEEVGDVDCLFYNGSYTNIETDPVTDKITITWKVWGKPLLQRFILERYMDSLLNLGYQIKLGTLQGDGTYSIDYTSEEVFELPKTMEMFLFNW